jgi:competence protein ComGC
MKHTKLDNSKSTRLVWPWIVLLIIILLFVIILVIGVCANKANTTNNGTSTNNTLLQSSCISQAQVEDDNNQDYQPVAGGEYGVNSLKASRKATDMQSKIADCKAEYPIQ